jgi:hypothetical protein
MDAHLGIVRSRAHGADRLRHFGLDGLHDSAAEKVGRRSPPDKIKLFLGKPAPEFWASETRHLRVRNFGGILGKARAGMVLDK